MNNFNECNHHECDCKKVVVMEGPFSVYGFVKNETTYNYDESNYDYEEADYDWEKEEKTKAFMYCRHDKTCDNDGDLICAKCGLVLENLHINEYEDAEHGCFGGVPIHREKISAKEKQYNKKMKEMFPDLIFPEGNVMMKNIEERFKLRKKPGDRFPTMKNIIHFILTKHEMTNLANTITLSKSDKFQDLMEKIFKEDDELPPFEMFKKLYKNIKKV